MSPTFQLDGFEPLKRIGGGGFGDVWLARQTNVDREVAIKVGHAPIQDDTIKLRFTRECKALGRLSGHPNIVGVHFAGSLNDGRPYLVLEYVDGGTLWQRLKREAIPEPDLISIGLQIAGGLDKAHTSGILHRDLKPENILMRSNGEAVLGDFGIARLQDGANTTSAAITASVAYAAPEVLGGTKGTVASDIYGVGICLLAAIIRDVPFVERQDESIHPIINRVLSEAPPSTRGRGISEELASTLDWTLAKNPAHRPSSASELYERFAQLGGQAYRSPLISSDPSRTGPSRVPPVRVPSADDGRTALSPRPSSATGVAQQSPSPVSLSGRPATTGDIPQRSLQAANYASNGFDRSLPSARSLHADPTPGTSIKAFAAAYAATLLVGAIIIYLLAQLIT